MQDVSTTITATRPPATAPRRRPAFTLIELLTVIAIIALLISILVPSLSRARDYAKETVSRGTMQAISGGVETFKADSDIGGKYPPSGSDYRDGGGLNPNIVASPLQPDASDPLEMVSGANLVVFALFGADRIGTPGFPDLNGDGFWWNDQHKRPPEPPDPGGAYAVEDGEPVRPRYGPFCDDSMRAKLKSVEDLLKAGKLRNEANCGLVGQVEGTLPFFVDEFDQPFLYYRARSAATAMLTIPGDTIGVYDHRDNQYITGSVNNNINGVWFEQKPHLLSEAAAPTPLDSPFGQYLLDQTVTVRPTPHNPDKFLLISPGRDGLYGTKDDIRNWE